MAQIRAHPLLLPMTPTVEWSVRYGPFPLTLPTTQVLSSLKTSHSTAVHYSQQPASVSIEPPHVLPGGASDSRIVHAKLQGFITAPILLQAMRELEKGLLAHTQLTSAARADHGGDRGRRMGEPQASDSLDGGDGAPNTAPPGLQPGGEAVVPGFLCDVSEVAGYGADTAKVARRWLDRAQRHGVRKIALVAHSSVLRTTVELLRGRTAVDISCFPSERSARAWLSQD